MVTLKRQVFKGVGLSSLSALVTAAAQVAQLMILARLLGPDVFGLMALVLIVVSLADLLGQMGLHEAVIAREDLSHAEFSSLYWFGLGWGVAAYLVFLSSTPLIAFAIGVDELRVLLPVALVSVVISPFGSQYLALAQRSLNFGLIAWVEIASAIAGLVCAVASAWLWDQGVWALVWGHLSRNFIRTAALAMHGWIEGPRPDRHFDPADLREMLGFGLYRVAAMGVNMLNSRADQLLIGGLFGVQALGFYSLASNLTLMPMQMINPAVTRVAFPVFARMKADMPVLKDGYLQLLRALTLVNAPILVGIAVVAPIAVPVFLGEQWRDAVPLVQILAVYTLLRSVGNASGSLILGLGRADITLYWNVALLFVVMPIVYVASLTGSLVTVAWSLVALQAILYMALYVLIVRKLVGACFASFAGAFAVPSGLAVAMGGLVLGLGAASGGLPEVTQLFVLILSGVTCFVSLALVFQRRYLGQVLQIVRGRPWDLGG